MEFQIVDEVTTFWSNIFPPVFLGTISIILFLWALGKPFREHIVKECVVNKDNKYVLENGIYIPKKTSIKYSFYKYISKKIGLDSLKPILAIFIVFLFFFGLNQLLLLIFQPLLTCSTHSIIYASGIDNYTLADIWRHYPNAHSSGQLYSIIEELAGENHHVSNIFLYSLEAFLRFNLLSCFIMIIVIPIKSHKCKWFNKLIVLRLSVLMLVFVIFIIGILFCQIQTKNNETRSICYQAHYLLNKNDPTIYNNECDEERDKYLSLIKKEKEMYEEELYFGAFGIRIPLEEYLENIFREFYRFSEKSK